ncbi:MAG TPA: pyridoxamine 5'-phosphate oxidase family protein [Solirubrobacteraceae bacterium]|nr:pyridoxamine 5'-phosphate oxidase family protein [Solirubrobacteraceae bacterium]
MTSSIWPDSVETILGGEHAVMLGYVTPARGVVLTPVTNFALHDRGAGTVSINTSVGAWKKLARLRANPNVALAFHTRAHADHERPEYVLVQGRASLGAAVEDYPSTVLEQWERIEPWGGLGPLAKRWLRVYGRRVEVEVLVERVVVWPDLTCAGPLQAYGLELTETPPPSQKPPAKGTSPRVAHRRAAWEARRLPDVLLGWVGADERPMIVPVGIGPTVRQGIELLAPLGLLPPGARRAGLTAHWFSHGVTGQRQIVHTGWLDGNTYAPHTRASYFMPPSRFVYRLVVGGATRRRYRSAERAGESV